MRATWIGRLTLILALGGTTLTMAVSLSKAQPNLPAVRIDQDDFGPLVPLRDGPIGPQAAPSASITAPSAAMGDFGASQGNAWNMDSTGDIAWTQTNASGQGIQLSQPSPGIVRGQVPEGSDLAIAFYTSSSTPLPSSQYHQLTYRLKIAAEGSCKTNGRVVYAKNWPVWLGSQVFSHGYLPHEVPMSCPFGQWCIYYMDLSRNDNDIVGPDIATWFSNPPPWPTDPVRAFGLWPHERWANCGGGPNYFDLDYVYLTGDIVAKEKDGYKYTARWTVSDPDGGSIVSTIRHMEVDELQLPANSPSCNASNFGDPVAPPSYPEKIYLPLVIASQVGAGGAWQDFSPVARKTTSTGQQSYQLNFSDDVKFADGKSYYLCIQVDDGTSKRYTVSSAPVIRVPHSPNYGHE